MFKIDKENPRDALLEATGSRQQQSGIIWGDGNSGIVIATSGEKEGSIILLILQPCFKLPPSYSPLKHC